MLKKLPECVSGVSVVFKDGVANALRELSVSLWKGNCVLYKSLCFLFNAFRAGVHIPPSEINEFPLSLEIECLSASPWCCYYASLYVATHIC